MKIAILGLNADALFFIERANFLKIKDLNFFAFDERKKQNSYKKKYSNLLTPWSINDVFSNSDIVLNCSYLSSLDLALQIFTDNKVKSPIIDFSPNKQFSINNFKKYKLLNNNVIHSMSPGRMNFNFRQENIKLPVVLDSQIKAGLNEPINQLFNKLNIAIKFLDILEHDEILKSNYYLPNLLLFSLSKLMNEKSKILSNNLNNQYILNISELINIDVKDDLVENYFNKDLNSLSLEVNMMMNNVFANKKVLDDPIFMNSKQIANHLDPNSAIPKSRDTIMSLFFGTRFTRLVSGWSKIDKPDD